ncbi:MAG: DNA primase [Planctomycetes bacterium]|nr:DNA primase [Planctomycetota bacterium]
MPGVYDYAAINRVQQANDIVDVIGEHVSLKKTGRELIGLCPFHEDHRPSMNVNPVKQIFKCFACGAGGDVLKFIQMREGLTFPQAIERLAERAGLALQPVRRAMPAAPGQPNDIDPNLLARVNKWAAQFFQQCLTHPEKGKHAREYLEGRGISQESIGKWRLGLAPNAVDALAKAAAQRKIPAQLLQQAGLTTASGQDKFVNRLMFVITDVTGRVTAFGGRTLDGTGAKYINSPTTPLFDKSNTLYGLEQARHQIVATGTAVVVEGYTDVIMPHQHGCTNLVATLGTSFTAGHGRILRRYAKRVVLLFDSDTAGMAAANRALEVCLSQHLDIKLAFVPQGKDPCDFVRTAGKEGLDQVVAQATDVLQFKWDRLRETFAADDTLASRKGAVEEFLQAVAIGFGSNNLPVLESGLIVNKLAKMIGLPEAEIRKELGRRIKPPAEPVRTDGRAVDGSSVTDWGEGLSAAAQREVLEVLLNEPGLFHRVEPGVSQDLFDVPVLAQIAAILLEVIQSEEDFSLSRVLARAESVEIGERIVELQRVGEEKGNYPSRLADALRVLHGRSGRGADARTSLAVAEVNSARPAGGSPGRQHPHSIGIT